MVTIATNFSFWGKNSNLVQVFMIPLDYVTMVFALWNFTVVGLVSIFWKGPLWLQQIYLTVMSSLMAFSLTGLEQWTTWILLGLLAIWDLIAVLCPFGPLRLLIESSKNQQREVPALLYSVNAVWLMMASAGEHFNQPSSSARNSREYQSTVERNGLKLGLGDFVFYSVLVARAAMYDWITTVCCTIAVLTGLTATIFLLAIYKKALPALPISIAFGILFYFVAKTVLVPYICELVVFGMIGL
ncbi:Presenilin-domain-containing protein [Rhizopus microsporus var. microsporus]|uniref:Presenilin n=1 Tax=Rhizopus microsporus var. microsporus TaxID=86635 RepID=A0A1X0R619_RHIZD|nr:Presenilin-domain-containing protein [Rhizopus microsporus var. microsporus]